MHHCGSDSSLIHPPPPPKKKPTTKNSWIYSVCFMNKGCDRKKYF